MPRDRRRKALVAWSSGKDSALALWETRRRGELAVIGLITTLSRPYRRVSMHGVRESLLERQAGALCLPLTKVFLPDPCADEVYEAAMAEALAPWRARGVGTVVFGDLFLSDVRAWRTARLAGLGLAGQFPLWGRETGALAREMLGLGMRARIVCLDPRKIEPSFAGRPFDQRFLAALGREVDPCGENGEFHTVVTAGPMFREPLRVRHGPTVARDGFVFADIAPA